MALMIYDTRRKQKVLFKPINPGNVSMYVCGVTVYDLCHLGHARCYVAFDVIHRWLESSGYDVNYIQNFTDIDDKIIKRAKEQEVNFLELVEQNINAYFEDMDSLNILRADEYPRCTEYVEQMISITEDLINKGHAYVANDGVYFHVESAPEKYGVLTGQRIDAVLGGAGGRVSKTGDGKRDHKDFALWKLAKSGEPSWASPWGDGRPGWHIECTAMSMDHLGEQFDIHGGGHDLRFPHHEAEIFQGECHTGKSPVVNYWLHNGFVNMDGEKMSKSLGNFWTIRDIIAKINPLVLRFALINAQYRSPIDMNEKLLQDAEINHQRLLDSYKLALDSWNNTEENNLRRLPEPNITSSEPLSHSLGLIEKFAEEFALAMDDDFNTREAVTKTMSVAREITRLLNSDLDEDDKQSVGFFAVELFEQQAGNVLGLLPTREQISVMNQESLEVKNRKDKISEKVEGLLLQRSQARSEKNWSKADQIRDELNEMGVTVKDTSEGPIWDLI
ncbi:MAG: cysteine--tRNA ligase [Euryarchaeota archaeon]|nr:cysteine--tRNA ligase [Euryarchaeota archaeon]|tara:strand:+ start:11979 stop:13487 length:1509 start_codon:yes stop_codon:yes gene_type:complete